MIMYGLYGFLLGRIREKNANPVLFVLSAPGLFIAFRLVNALAVYAINLRGLSFPFLGFLGYQLLPMLAGALVIAVISLVTVVVYKHCSTARAKGG
jgi:phosphotransferase system  glucose/maltose/N-acetylglucosamine-specific IIC component